MKLGGAACWSPSHSDKNNSWLGSSHPCRVQSLCQCLDCKAVPSHTITLPWLKVVCRINVSHLFGEKKQEMFTGEINSENCLEICHKVQMYSENKGGSSWIISWEKNCAEFHTHSHSHMHIHKKPSWRVHLAWLCYRFILIWGNVREGKGCASLKAQRRKTVLID